MARPKLLQTYQLPLTHPLGIFLREPSEATANSSKEPKESIFTLSHLKSRLMLAAGSLETSGSSHNFLSEVLLRTIPSYFGSHMKLQKRC